MITRLISYHNYVILWIRGDVVSNKLEEYQIWKSEVLALHLARWEELPDLELYMDQVLIFTEKQLAPFNVTSEKMLTAAMVNNYVKAGLLPKPIKKKYSKVHLAYILAITILKQVVPIIQVRDGIDFTAKAYGAKGAYNLFCQELEGAFGLLLEHKNQPIEAASPIAIDYGLRYLTVAFASKMIAMKVIESQEEEKDGE